MDIFSYSNDAAVDFVKCYNIWTQLHGKKRGACIYKITYIKNFAINTRYFYPNSIIGQHDNLVAGFISGYLLLPRINQGVILKVELYAWVHTHPLCKCHLGNQFSKPDIALTFLPSIRYCYVGIPYGFCYRIGPYGMNHRSIAAGLPTTYYWPSYNI